MAIKFLLFSMPVKKPKSFSSIFFVLFKEKINLTLFGEVAKKLSIEEIHPKIQIPLFADSLNSRQF